MEVIINVLFPVPHVNYLTFLLRVPKSVKVNLVQVHIVMKVNLLKLFTLYDHERYPICHHLFLMRQPMRTCLTGIKLSYVLTPTQYFRSLQEVRAR
jgi:hypothetical protein